MSTIKTAAAATDQIVDGINEARESLRDCFVNGAGVLADPSSTRNDLKSAKAAIESALAALNGVTAWPTNDDYDLLDKASV